MTWMDVEPSGTLKVKKHKGSLLWVLQKNLSKGFYMEHFRVFSYL
jgi:hypothetical protein